MFDEIIVLQCVMSKGLSNLGPTAGDNISGTNSSFHVGWCTTGKV